MSEAKTATTSPGDEREAFEAWRRATTKMNPDDAVALRGFGDDAGYDNTYTRCMHMAWMARASLSQSQGEGDAARLDWLEEQINKNGAIHLHDGNNPYGLGLGLRPGYVVRTLREAIDAAMTPPAPTEQDQQP